MVPFAGLNVSKCLETFSENVSEHIFENVSEHLFEGGCGHQEQ